MRVDGIDFDEIVVNPGEIDQEEAVKGLKANGKQVGFPRVDRLRELQRKGWGLVTEVGKSGAPAIFTDGLKQLVLMYSPVDAEEPVSKPLPTFEVRTRGLQLVERLYERSGGSIYDPLDAYEAGKELGWDDHQLIDQIIHYLHGRGLLKSLVQQGTVILTREGMAEIERAMAAPDQATANFPPTNFIHAGTINLAAGAQLMQGRDHLHQVSQQRLDGVPLHEALAEIERLAKGLADAERAQVEALVTVAKTEAAKSAPDQGIVKTILGAMRDIGLKVMTSTAENIAAPAIVEVIKGLIGS